MDPIILLRAVWHSDNDGRDLVLILHEVYALFVLFLGEGHL